MITMFEVIRDIAWLSAVCFGSAAIMIYIDDGFPFFKDKGTDWRTQRLQRVVVEARRNAVRKKTGQ